MLLCIFKLPVYLENIEKKLSQKVKKMEKLYRLSKKRNNDSSRNIYEMFKEKCQNIPISFSENENLFVRDPEEEKRIKYEKEK